MTEQTQVETVEVMKSVAQLKGFVTYTFETEDIAQSVVSSLTEDLMLENTFRECGDYDQHTSGTTMFSEEETFLVTSKGSTMFQITTQVKKPHGASVKKLCKERETEYLQKNDVAKADKEVKALIKESVIKSLLPSTVADDPKTTVMWVTGKYLIVGEPSYKKAEDFVDSLRTIAGSCPVSPVVTKEDVSEKLTDMLSKGYDDTLALLNLAHLQEEDGKGLVKFEKASLYDTDHKKHIDQGCTVTKMQMTKDYETDFTLNNELEFSGVKVDKEILTGSKGLGSLLITVDEVNKVVTEVLRVFGEG